MVQAMRTRLLIASVGVLALLCLLSLGIGTRTVPPGDLLAVLAGDGPPDVEALVWGGRLPRTLLGLLVGAALGLAGAVMQALTRNPLADPGLLGISAGAAFGIVVAVAATGVASLYGYLGFAFAARAWWCTCWAARAGVARRRSSWRSPGSRSPRC
jgi:iron complex transport system permease protein